jgi:predicted 3-demethylubiquinone-9 3-methyltransferase (glyoxalase superfamily)
MQGSGIRSVVPCLWFDGKAEEAARFYVSIFPNSHITSLSHYGKEGYEIHHHPEGEVLTVEFELDGHPFTAMNGGPEFTFSLAVSFQVMCEGQVEIDYYWECLGAGGDPSAQVCGWLKDKYGLSWQVVWADMDKWVGDARSAKAQRAMRALLQMRKIEIAALKHAYEG